MQHKIYIAVTADELELPLCVGDIYEMARYSGVSTSNIYSMVSRKQSGKILGMRFYEVDGIGAKKEKPRVDIILEHLKAYGSINVMQAIELYGIKQLSPSIVILRKRGYNITQRRLDGKDSLGRNHVIVEYKLEEGVDDERRSV